MSDNKLMKKEANDVSFFDQADGLGYDGFENVTADMLALPFLKIAQSMSPEVQPGDAAIPGLKPGDFFNSITGQVYGPVLDMILLGYDMAYLEWEKGQLGQFKGRLTAKDLEDQLATGEVIKAPDGFSFVRPAGNTDIKETHTFFVMLPGHEDDGVLLFSMKSSGIKYVKKWLTKARAVRVKVSGQDLPVRAKLFSVIWRVKVVVTSNNKGTWYQIGDGRMLAVQQVGTMADEAYMPIQGVVLEAAQFVKEAQFKVDYSGVGQAHDDVIDDSEM